MALLITAVSPTPKSNRQTPFSQCSSVKTLIARSAKRIVFYSPDSLLKPRFPNSTLESNQPARSSKRTQRIPTLPSPIRTSFISDRWVLYFRYTITLKHPAATGRRSLGFPEAWERRIKILYCIVLYCIVSCWLLFRVMMLGYRCSEVSEVEGDGDGGLVCRSRRTRGAGTLIAVL